MKKIGLDAGHGINTAGKRTPDGIHEWTLNDKVRDYIIEILKEYDCQIICSDDYDDGQTDIGLTTRKKTMLNNNVDLYISIHHNALNGIWGNHTGVEVYVDRNCTAQDKKLAELVNSRLSQYTGLRNRGIKEANFTVINQNQIPAILVEGGFMDSNIDYKVITSEEGQRAYAKAVAEAIIEYLNLGKGQAKVGNLLVLNWQHAMNVSYNCGLEEDGKFGPDCKAKAKKYQLYYKKPVFKNEHAKFMQERLYANGYNVEIDSKFGPDCDKKTRAYQEAKGLKVDGYIGVDTTISLLGL